jgi:hypothetical protein
VKTLLDEQFAPITSQIGFLRLPFARALQELEEWHASRYGQLRVTRLSEDLGAALKRLPPLSPTPARALVMEVRGGWCAYFDSTLVDPAGSDGRSTIGHLARTLRCDGLRVVTVPHTAGSWSIERGRSGSVEWQLSHRTDWAQAERVVAVSYRDARWEFVSSGPELAFEESAAYRAPRIRDRFTTAMLERYCRALGLDAFDPAAYGPVGALLEHRTRRVWPGRAVSLADAQKRLGIVPGAARAIPG